jgi:hypothetical protein
MRKKTPSWSKLAAAAFKLGVTANTVVALRLAKLVKGGSPAKRESKLMVAEKIAAAQKAGLAAARDVALGRAVQTPQRTMAIYQKRVSRNIQRLWPKL